MANRLDLSEMKFGRWLVLKQSKDVGKRTTWVCRCDCGTQKIVMTEKLRNGESTSCGCFKKETISKLKKVHGMSKSRFYGIWNDMMMRCYNPNKERYINYGGRGIGVCIKWHKFNNFYLDMFPSYVRGLSLERSNVNKNYSKSNCCWIIKDKQKYNKTTTVRLTICRLTLSATEWSLICGCNVFKIYGRKRRGWPDKECVFGKKATRDEIRGIINEYSRKLKQLQK